ncbi:restriction methylase [Escherichia coli O145:H28]|nr:restriction methylase [Escherichia coli O145:H28]
MNQTLPTADLNTAGTTDVIPSVAIDRIIAQRNEGIALFMQAMECLVRITVKEIGE